MAQDWPAVGPRRRPASRRCSRGWRIRRCPGGAPCLVEGVFGTRHPANGSPRHYAAPDHHAARAAARAAAFCAVFSQTTARHSQGGPWDCSSSAIPWSARAAIYRPISTPISLRQPNRAGLGRASAGRYRGQRRDQFAWIGKRLQCGRRGHARHLRGRIGGAGAHIQVYFTTWDENGWVLALKRAVHPHAGERRPSVLSISSGIGPSLTVSANIVDPRCRCPSHGAFHEAALFGITVFVASGDDGSNCQVYDGNAHVYYPESNPWVTSCGGTTIGNVSGSSFVEVAWTDNGITGGGVSDFFDLRRALGNVMPDIPLSVNPGQRKGRGVPNIAGYANGYEIVLPRGEVSRLVGHQRDRSPLRRPHRDHQTPPARARRLPQSAPLFAPRPARPRRH